MAPDSSARLAECSDCPRLVALRREVRARHPDYHARPVLPWGRKDARLLIVGLAPGMHGANRTGRPFTGDASGDFLFAALHRAGLASAPEAARATLANVRITNAVKCLPPANRPTAAEIGRCRPYLEAEIGELTGQAPRRPRCILCLGRIAHDAVGGALSAQSAALPGFGHGAVMEVLPRLHVADTYHPSRQNTNTGRLTAAMLDSVLATVTGILAG